MSRNAPGTYIAMYWDDGTDGPREYVYGHVTDLHFADTMKCEGREATLSKPRHAWARFVPSRSSCYDQKLIDCERGRGAFPVTVADVKEGR